MVDKKKNRKSLEREREGEIKQEIKISTNLGKNWLSGTPPRVFYFLFLCSMSVPEYIMEADIQLKTTPNAFYYVLFISLTQE